MFSDKLRMRSSSRLISSISVLRIRPDAITCEEGTTWKVCRTVACKPRPESGLDCPTCAIFARKRTKQPLDPQFVASDLVNFSPQDPPRRDHLYPGLQRLIGERAEVLEAKSVEIIQIPPATRKPDPENPESRIRNPEPETVICRV